MAEKSKTGSLRDPLEKADKALIRIERVLEQILLLARIEATGAGPVLNEVNVAALARGVTADLLPQAVALQKDLGYEGPDRAIALSEEVLLGELLRNLVDNAITHCPADTMVTVQVKPLDTQDICIAVVDTGPPVPETDLNLMRARLDPLGEAGELRTGTRGLGLHIVAEIAQALQADIRLERGGSGRGLAWSITLPAWPSH